jgi:hypothetical protein
MQKFKFSSQIALVSLPAQEMLRNPITVLLSLATVFMTLLIPLVLAFQFGDTGKRLVRDGGLGLQLTFGIILASACACNLIQKERQSGVAAMLLTKPVGRHTYLLSRFVGIGLVLFVFSSSAAIATMLAHRSAEGFDPDVGLQTDRITASAGLLCIVIAAGIAGWRNWLRNDSFHAITITSLPVLLAMLSLLCGFYTRAGRLTWVYAPQQDPRILLVALAIYLLLLVFTALALTMSIYLKPVNTTLTCIIILLTGFSTPVWMAKAQFMPFVALFPNWNWFWLANHLNAGQSGLTTSFLFAGGYGSLLIAAILCIGFLLIEKAEVPS